MKERSLAYYCERGGESLRVQRSESSDKFMGWLYVILAVVGLLALLQ